MGLQNTANYLQSKGRGKDTMLVHMSPREVKGLQALAMAHGGSLTSNPDTGLPEAGFLENILPMVAGAALTIGSGGALSPLTAGLIVGGGYGLATGSITKGLLAGLGAYGGAGLGTSLGALGAETTAAATQKAATEGFKKVGEEAITAGLENLPVGSGGVGIPTESGMYFPGATPGAGTEIGSAAAPSAAGTNYYQQAAQNYINPQNFPGLTPTQVEAAKSGLPEAVRYGSTPEQYMGSLGRASAAQTATPTANVVTGLKEVSSSPSAAGQFVKSNVGTLGSAIAPSLIGGDQQGVGQPGYQSDEYDERLRKYKLSPNYQAYEAPRPNPYYQAQYAAEGGIMKLQGGGGPVERMSMMNTAMSPQGGLYPMGMIDKTQYATPTQRPVSAELVTDAPAYEKSNPMLMAEGGIARYRNRGQVNVLQDYLDRQGQQQLSPLPESVGVPRTGIFRDTDVDTARKDALTAAMIRLGKASKGAGIKPMTLPKTAIKGLGDISGATQDTTEAAAGGTMRYNLGGYSDGGRMLKGPGDGMSDSIPATIAGKQPARLADGEFVVPADVVSHLGNGSTDAGAKKLYGMMDKIRKARTGKKKQAPAVKASRYMPA
jgi:hypothetical protein